VQVIVVEFHQAECLDQLDHENLCTKFLRFVCIQQTGYYLLHYLVEISVFIDVIINS